MRLGWRASYLRPLRIDQALRASRAAAIFFATLRFSMGDVVLMLELFEVGEDFGGPQRIKVTIDF
jgi:hypothetical protein